MLKWPHSRALPSCLRYLLTLRCAACVRFKIINAKREEIFDNKSKSRSHVKYALTPLNHLTFVNGFRRTGQKPNDSDTLLPRKMSRSVPSWYIGLFLVLSLTSSFQAVGFGSNDRMDLKNNDANAELTTKFQKHSISILELQSLG